MKLDYDMFKQILSQIEEETDGFNYFQETFETYKQNVLGRPKVDIRDLTQQEFEEVWLKQDEADLKVYYHYAYHFKLLAESGFIDGRVDGETMGNIVPTLIYQGLTLEGHQALEAMQNDTLWKRVSAQVKSLGQEGLKQIPALAMQTLWGAAVS